MTQETNTRVEFYQGMSLGCIEKGTLSLEFHKSKISGFVNDTLPVPGQYIRITFRLEHEEFCFHLPKSDSSFLKELKTALVSCQRVQFKCVTVCLLESNNDVLNTIEKNYSVHIGSVWFTFTEVTIGEHEGAQDTVTLEDMVNNVFHNKKSEDVPPDLSALLQLKTVLSKEPLIGLAKNHCIDLKLYNLDVCLTLMTTMEIQKVSGLDYDGIDPFMLSCGILEIQSANNPDFKISLYMGLGLDKLGKTLDEGCADLSLVVIGESPMIFKRDYYNFKFTQRGFETYIPSGI